MWSFAPQSSSLLLLVWAFLFAQHQTSSYLAAVATDGAAFLHNHHHQHERSRNGARQILRINQLVTRTPPPTAVAFPIYTNTFQLTRRWNRAAMVSEAAAAAGGGLRRRRNRVPTTWLRHVHDASTDELDASNSSSRTRATLSTIRDYIDLIRPFTLLQAVGSLIVGFLIRTTASSSSAPPLLGNHGPPTMSLMAALVSVYLSYGTGMVANDCVDASFDALDHGGGNHHNNDESIDNKSNKKKSKRPIASGRISTRAGCIFAAALSIVSLALSLCCCIPARTLAFTWWTCCNLAVMYAYAFLGLQKILLVKNILVGWLGVSPLIMGATLSTALCTSGADDRVVCKTMETLIRLAIIGFATGTAREILKDAQDVDIDTIGNNKATIPRLLGIDMAHKIAYVIIASCCIACWLPGYRSIFSSPQSPFPIYSTAMALGTTMCVRASTLSLDKGQALFKKSIYVMLGGMIGGLVLIAKG